MENPYFRAFHPSASIIYCSAAKPLQSSEDILLALRANRVLVHSAATVQPLAAMRASIQLYFQEDIQRHNNNRQQNISGKYKCHCRQSIKYQAELLELFELCQ